MALGDVGELGANAAIMLKVSVLAAWAELQVASSKRPYLVDVVKPYRWLLGPFWIGALRDYAQLRTDPDMGAVAMTGAMDFNNGLGRDVLLPVSFDVDDADISTTSRPCRNYSTPQHSLSLRLIRLLSGQWTDKHSRLPQSRKHCH